MKRILFLVLSTIFILGATAQAIEIYADGHKYLSLQSYVLWKKSVHAQSIPVSLDQGQEDHIRLEAQKLGIKVDFNQLKTVLINQKNLSDAGLHKLYVLSVENGMVGALQDFYQTWGQAALQEPRRISSSEQLQGVIQQAVARSKYPKLLISEPGKIRIMALTARESDQ